MKQTSKDRDIKLALVSIKTIIDDIHNGTGQIKKQQTAMESAGELELMLRKMRVSKLKEVFLDKIKRDNIFKTPVNFNLKSQNQIDHQRAFKCKGIRSDERILSIIYILDIIFCLVTFVTGAFRAFLDDFTIQGDYQSSVIIALMIIAIIVTSLKILSTSVTKTIEDGIQMVYLTDILLNYFTKFFVFIDLAYVGINIASLILQNDNGPIAVALFILSILKLFSLYDNLRMFQTTFINSFKRQQYFNLMKVALFNIFFAHFVCSLLLAMSKLDSQNNWMINSAIDTQHWYIQYIWSFYWACTIMMTVGFGDFLPYTFKEAMIVAFLELFSCIVLAYNISEIGSIISAIRGSQTQFRRKIAIFKRMSKQDQIHQQLQRRIQGYLREQTEIKQKFQYNQQNQLLLQIPDNLRSEYIVQSNKRLFPDLPFFKNLQKSTLIKFTEHFKGKVFYPGEYLTRLDEGNDSIMILKTGIVGLAYKKYGSYLNGTIVQEMKVQKSEVVSTQGEFDKRVVPILLNTDFLTQKQKTNYDIVAQNYSFVFEITYEDFFECIKTSEIDSSYFYSIKHKHTLIQNEWQQVICQHCSTHNPQQQEEQNQFYQNNSKSKKTKDLMQAVKKKYHTKFDCPKLHYFPLPGIIILKTVRQQGLQQNRDESAYRSKKRQSQCLLIRKAFFKPYEKARNISFVKSQTFAQKMHCKRQHLKSMFQKKQQNEDKSLAMTLKSEQYKKEQILTIERVVRQAIEEAMTGYRPDFWQLQIDVLYNYTNYFPLQNSKNLDLVHLKKPKLGRMSSSVGNPDNKKKSILMLLKDFGQRYQNQINQ